MRVFVHASVFVRVCKQVDILLGVKAPLDLSLDTNIKAGLTDDLVLRRVRLARVLYDVELISRQVAQRERVDAERDDAEQRRQRRHDDPEHVLVLRRQVAAGWKTVTTFDTFLSWSRSVSNSTGLADCRLSTNLTRHKNFNKS